MKFDSGCWEFFGSPVKVNRNAGDAENTGIVAENGYLIPLGCGDFTVNKELFDALGTAWEPNGITGLAAAKKDIAYRNHCKNVCRVDDPVGGRTIKLQIWGSDFRYHFQQTIIPADGNATGEISPGGRVVGKDQRFQ